MDIPNADAELFDLVLRHAVGGVYIYDVPSASNVFVNARYTALTGYTLDEINTLGAEGRFLELFHPSDVDEVLAHMGEVGAAPVGEAVELEYRFRRKEGGWMWCLSRDVALSRDADGNMDRFLGSFVDITAQKDAARDVEQFAHMAAHDLRAPARRVHQLIGLATRDLGENRWLRSIANESRRMIELVDDFRALSGPHGDALEARETDVGEIVSEVVVALEDALVEHDAKVRAAEDWPRLSVAPGAVTTLYRNLLENALKYGGRGTQVELGFRAPEGTAAVFWVSNTGSSIDEEAVARVFEPFVRMDADSSGSGLGLAIAQRVATAHGGRIWIESADDPVQVCFTLGPG